MGVLAAAAEALYFWRKRVASLEKGADGGARRVSEKLVDLLVRLNNTLELLAEEVVALGGVVLAGAEEASLLVVLGVIWEAKIAPDFGASFLLLFFFFFLAMVVLLLLRCCSFRRRGMQ